MRGVKRDKELERHNAMFAEWEAWKKLCNELRKMGAVTEADLSSPVTERDTSGKRLLEAIRDWGRKLVELRGSK